MKGVKNTLLRWIGSGDKPTERASLPQGTAPPPLPDATDYEVVACMMTDVGCHREVNEDNVQYIHPADPARRAEKGSLVVVADGMGGHVAGEIASRMAVDIIPRVYYESTNTPHVALEQAFHEANRAIHAAAQTDDHKGMGTTGTALVLRDSEALYAHVGDSRLYLVRDGSIFLMSEDHSLVMEMVRQGMISTEEARYHDDKNVILRALGTKPEVAVTLWAEALRVGVGDVFLLCSDGLYDLVEDDEMLVIIASALPNEACAQLIALAKERGGHDNITVGLVALIASDEEAEAPVERPTREVKMLQPEDIRPTREVVVEGSGRTGEGEREKRAASDERGVAD